MVSLSAVSKTRPQFSSFHCSNMLCDIDNNVPRRLDNPVNVQCRRCGAKYSIRVFPLRAECGLSDVAEFWDSIEHDQIAGLGDLVEKAISALTFGLIEKKEGCGCEDRKQWLNKLWSWKSRQ